jgi:hypothetical protein
MVFDNNGRINRRRERRCDRFVSQWVSGFKRKLLKAADPLEARWRVETKRRLC